MAMAGLSVIKIRDTVDAVFPSKTFCLSLALLVFLLIITIGIHQLFFVKPAEHIALTGKTMALVDVAEQIKEEPIQTIVEGEKPEPEPAVETPHTEEIHQTETTIEDSIAGLSEETPFGYLPIVRASDGLRSFDAYKTPFKLAADTKGIISLVMVDYGLSDKLSKNAIETLPAATTFIANPYAENLQAKVSGARSKGMEIWMGVPMQGIGNAGAVNYGPNTILIGLTAKENVLRLNAHLGRATGYTGIAFDVKPDFGDDKTELQALLDTASMRGLGVVQLEPTDTQINAVATQHNVPNINGDIWIDDTLTKDAITTQLANAEKQSLSGGHAVAVFYPSVFTTTIIAEWQKSLAAKQIQLAPLTYAVHISRDAPNKEATPAEKPADKAEAVKETPKTETTHTETPHHESH